MFLKELEFNMFIKIWQLAPNEMDYKSLNCLIYSFTKIITLVGKLWNFAKESKLDINKILTIYLVYKIICFFYDIFINENKK